MVEVLGHGSGSGEFALNGIASLHMALAAGADGVEVDVRRTADDQLVLCHDAAVDGRLVHESPAAALRLPLLEDALDLCAGRIVNVELKNFSIDPAYDATERVTDLLIDRIARRGGHDRLVISSFGPACTARVRARASHLTTAHLMFYGGDPEALLDEVVAAGHPRVHPYAPLVDRAFVEAARKRDLAVHVWFNDDETAQRVGELAALEVDGFITCDPAMVRGVLGSGLQAVT